MFAEGSETRELRILMVSSVDFEIAKALGLKNLWHKILVKILLLFFNELNDDHKFY